MVKWWLWRAGSRRSSEPKAEATGLAPKQAADRHDPLASPSEGSVFAHSRIAPSRTSPCSPAAAFVAPGAHPSRRRLRLADGLPLRPAPSRWWVWQRLRVWENDCFGEVSELRPWAETTRRSPGAVCPALPMKFWLGSGR